ncbi:SulP family inorganic anion transporter [Rhodobacterales bacterium HKCCE2091]|nr:SulP family inorganic anion transporter [Rhodobacterales bacterium HKCCE2091]
MKPKILSTLPGYTRAQLLSDLFAGITVAMVAIPLSLAIAIASGAGPAEGLVTAIVGGFLVSLLGGSRVQIGGPTGAFIVVVFGVIAAHGYDGLVTATFMAGIILLLAGWLRVGNLVAYVPEPVIHGFTLGIAAIIALSQLKDLLGLDPAENPADTVEKVAALWEARDTFDWRSLAIGLVAGGLILALRNLLPRRWPSLVIAVALASALAAIPALSVDTIGSRFGALPNTLPAPRLPDLSPARLQELLPAAVTIAFLAGIESLLSAVVADRMIGGRHRPRAEVVAQGAANLASSLFAGLPVTGAIARTATNVRSGGRTPVAGIVHAVVILAVMLVAAPLAAGLALPAMAAVLIITAWNMAEPEKWRGMLALPATDKALVALTFALTLLVDLTVAIAVGVAVGLALRLRAGKLGPEAQDPRDH